MDNLTSTNKPTGVPLESPTEEDFNVFQSVITSETGDETVASILMALTPMLIEGKPWGIVEPDLMQDRDFLAAGNRLNSTKGVPVKLFQLADGWGLLWGYSLEKTCGWYLEQLTKTEGKGVSCEKLLGYPLGELREVIERNSKVEIAKATQLLPKDGDIVGLFNISDEYSVILDRESYPQWGIPVNSIKGGLVRPMGMPYSEFTDNRNNLTYLLKHTKVSPSGTCLLFQWVLDNWPR